MKYFLLLCTLIAAPITIRAQWVSYGFGSLPSAVSFGILDSTLFVNFHSSNGYSLLRHNRGEDWSGIHWTQADAGINYNGGSVTSFTSIGQYLFVGLTTPDNSDPAYRLTDTGRSWMEAIGGPVAANRTYIYATYADSIARSIDGLNWKHISHIPGVSQLNPVTQYYVADSALLAVTSGRGLWRSADSGLSWDSIPYPLSMPIAFGTIGSTLFAAGYSGPGWNPAGPKGVGYSTDWGASWHTIAFSHYITALSTDGRNLFVGTFDSGVYISTDTGQHWRNVSEGMGHWLDVEAMIVFDTLLFVSSNYSMDFQNPNFNGMRPISEMVSDTPLSVVHTISSSDSIEIYPNPSMGTFSISSSGPIISIQVRSILGTDILSLSKLNQPGVSLDLSSEPAGTYFVQIETANGTVLRKIVRE